MLWHGAQAKAFDLEAAVREAVTAFRRAGEAGGRPGPRPPNPDPDPVCPRVSARPRGGSSARSLRRGRYHHHLLRAAAPALAAGGGGGTGLSGAGLPGAGLPGGAGPPVDSGAAHPPAR